MRAPGPLNTSSRFGVVERQVDREAFAQGIAERISSPARRAREAKCLPPSFPPGGRGLRIRTRPPRRSRGRAGTPTERNAAGGGRRRRGRPLRIVGGYIGRLGLACLALALLPGCPPGREGASGPLDPASIRVAAGTGG